MCFAQPFGLRLLDVLLPCGGDTTALHLSMALFVAFLAYPWVLGCHAHVASVAGVWEIVVFCWLGGRSGGFFRTC